MWQTILMEESKLWPKVYIILLNWNSGEITKECINSLLRIDYFNYEIIVVDNGSTDGSLQALKCLFPDVIFIENDKNLGFTGGNNVGMQFALGHEADYVLILNNDTIVERNFLKELIRAAESDPDVGVTTCKIYSYDEPDKLWAAGGGVNKFWLKSYPYGAGEFDKGQYDIPCKVEFVSGCCMLVKRRVIETVGMFDERFFAYSEDLDWCIRIIQSGFRMKYVPTSRIWHRYGSPTVRKNTFSDNILPGGSSTQTSTPLHHYFGIRNRLLIVKKHAKSARAFILLFALLGIFVYLTAGLLYLRRWEKLKKLWQGTLDGIKLVLWKWKD